MEDCYINLNLTEKCIWTYLWWSFNHKKHKQALANWTVTDFFSLINLISDNLKEMRTLYFKKPFYFMSLFLFNLLAKNMSISSFCFLILIIVSIKIIRNILSQKEKLIPLLSKLLVFWLTLKTKTLLSLRENNLFFKRISICQSLW